MQRDEVVAFLERIDSHLTTQLNDLLGGNNFKLKVIGKSALVLAGVPDTRGTIDIDSLGVDGHMPSDDEKKIVDGLLDEFGRPKYKVNGFYLEFIEPGFVFLPQTPNWTPLEKKFENLSVEFLEPNYVTASKLFSAFSQTPRKKDKQDIVEAIDLKFAEFQSVLSIADEIFDLYSMDARNERFPDVYRYVTQELMAKYGEARLEFKPDDET